VRYTVHHDLNGDRDLLFNLLRRDARPLRDDFDVVVGYVGICFNGELVEGDASPNEQEHRERDDENTVA
jgi:hypothetical protein